MMGRKMSLKLVPWQFQRKAVFSLGLLISAMRKIGAYRKKGLSLTMTIFRVIYSCPILEPLAHKKIYKTFTLKIKKATLKLNFV